MTCYFTEEEHARLVTAAQMAGVPLYVVITKVVGEFLRKNAASIEDAQKVLQEQKLEF